MAEISMRILLSTLGANSVTGALGQVSSSAGNLVGVLAGITAAAVGFGVASTKMAADYQQSQNMVQALTGATSDQMKQYDTGLKNLAIDAGVAPTALSKGLYNVISAGYSGKTAMDVLTLATKDSAIGMTSAAVTSNALTVALAAFKVPASDFNEVNGMMLRTVTAGKMSMSDYASAISKTSSVAVQYKDSMSDMNSILATLTASGIKNANVAGTDYNNLLKVLNGNTQSVADKSHALNSAFDEQAFKSMNVADKVDYLNKMITSHGHNISEVIGKQQNAAAAYTMLSTHMDMYRNNLKNLSDQQANANATQKAWAITQDGFNQQMNRASAAVQVLMIDVGSLLLPVLTNLLGRVTPIVTAFANWVSSGHAVSDMLTFFHAHAQIIIPVLSGIGAVILAVLVPAMLSLAVSVIAATWPFLLIGAAVAGLVAIFMHFYQSSAPFKAFIDNLVSGFKQAAQTVMANFGPAMSQVGTFMHTYVLPALQQVGGFLISTFKPVWDQLVATFNGEVKPAWASLVSAIQPLLPQLKQFAMFIGGIVATALILLVSVIGGVLHGLSSMLSGIISIFGGAVSVVTGAIKVVSGIIAVFIDLCTGNFGKLKGDLGTIMDGIGTMFHGVWEIIKGIFQAGIGFVVGFVKGFIDTITGIFHFLSNALVGHSIIPDMVNAIVSWFQQLPGRVIAFLSHLLSGAIALFTTLWSAAVALVSGMIGAILDWFGQLPGRVEAYISSLISSALGLFNTLWNAAIAIVSGMVNGIINWFLQLGSRVNSILGGIPGMVMGALTNAATAAFNGGMNIVNSIADGIRGAISNVGNAIGQVTSFISDHLPHSPAKIGPLTTLHRVGPEIVKQISDGMVSATPYLQGALGMVLSPLTQIGAGGSDRGVLADQLSFTHAPTSISSGTKAPVATTATKKAQAAKLKSAEATDAAEFKAINAEISNIQKREATKIKHERDAYNAEIKSIETRDKHLKGSAKKAEEAQIKAIRAHEKLQIANERKAFEAKIKADRTKEAKLKQEIHLNLTIHATKLDASEVDRLSQEVIKNFGNQIRAQFANI